MSAGGSIKKTGRRSWHRLVPEAWRTKKPRDYTPGSDPGPPYLLSLEGGDKITLDRRPVLVYDATNTNRTRCDCPRPRQLQAISLLSNRIGRPIDRNSFLYR